MAGTYLLRGHDVLTGIALVLLFLIEVAKVVFTVIARRLAMFFGFLRREPVPAISSGSQRLESQSRGAIEAGSRR